MIPSNEGNRMNSARDERFSMKRYWSAVGCWGRRGSLKRWVNLIPRERMVRLKVRFQQSGWMQIVGWEEGAGAGDGEWRGIKDWSGLEEWISKMLSFKCIYILQGVSWLCGNTQEKGSLDIWGWGVESVVRHTSFIYRALPIAYMMSRQNHIPWWMWTVTPYWSTWFGE